jgi:hypothetical protein
MTKRKRFSIPEQSTKGPFQRDMVEKNGNVGFKPEEKVKERTRGDLRHTTQSWWQEGKRGRINVILRPIKHAMLPYMYSVVSAAQGSTAHFLGRTTAAMIIPR